MMLSIPLHSISMLPNPMLSIPMLSTRAPPTSHTHSNPSFLLALFPLHSVSCLPQPGRTPAAFLIFDRVPTEPQEEAAPSLAAAMDLQALAPLPYPMPIDIGPAAIWNLLSPAVGTFLRSLSDRDCRSGLPSMGNPIL